MTTTPDPWQRIESDLDRKLLFKFDPTTLRVQIVTRRYHESTGRLRVPETVQLLAHMPPEVALAIGSVLTNYHLLRQAAGSATVTPA